jgi:hypothetical protein
MPISMAAPIECRLVSDVCCRMQHELAKPETPIFITGHPIGGFSARVPGAAIGVDDSIRIYRNDSS